MGQSRFVWIVVLDDGQTTTIVATWDELLNKLGEYYSPQAVIRCEFAPS